MKYRKFAIFEEEKTEILCYENHQPITSVRSLWKKNCWRNFSCSPWFSASGVRRDSSNAGVATPWRRDHSDATVQADFVSRRRRRRHKNELIAAKIYRSTYSSFVRNAYLEFCKVKREENICEINKSFFFKHRNMQRWLTFSFGRDGGRIKVEPVDDSRRRLDFGWC